MKIYNNMLIHVDDSDIKNGTFEIPKMIIGISDWAFQYCKKLERIQLPDNVKYLGHGIFDNCINLKEAYLSKNITELPYSTFNGCDNLDKITVSEENKKYYSRNGVLYNKNLTEIVVCPPKKEKVFLPNTIKTIKRNAFMGCNKLTNIKLPQNLTTIEGCVFSRCTNLTKLELPSNIKNVDYFSFFCSNIKQITLFDQVLKFDYSILENCNSLKTIVIKTKTNKGIPIPNSKDVYNFLNTKSEKIRSEIIKRSNDINVKSGLALYLFENEKLDTFADVIIHNLFDYGRFIIDNSGDKELKSLLTSNVLNKFNTNDYLLTELKRLQAYYTKQKTIELDLYEV